MTDNSYFEQLEQIKNYTILIVDDNKINQIVTKKLLAQIDVKNEAVGSGLKAIELVKANHYDCVLMDLNMPEIDGYESTRRIRAFNDTVKIVALTAASSEEIENKISDVKMNGYILKPFLVEDLVSTIVSSIDNKTNQ